MRCLAHDLNLHRDYEHKKPNYLEIYIFWIGKSTEQLLFIMTQYLSLQLVVILTALLDLNYWSTRD